MEMNLVTPQPYGHLNVKHVTALLVQYDGEYKVMSQPTAIYARVDGGITVRMPDPKESVTFYADDTLEIAILP